MLKFTLEQLNENKIDPNVKDWHGSPPLFYLVNTLLQDLPEESEEIRHKRRKGGFKFSIPETKEKIKFVCTYHEKFGLNFNAIVMTGTIFYHLCTSVHSDSINYARLVLENDSNHQIKLPRMNLSKEKNDLLRQFSIHYE